jgi:hypothetical protein
MCQPDFDIPDEAAVRTKEAEPVMDLESKGLDVRRETSDCSSSVSFSEDESRRIDDAESDSVVCRATGVGGRF